MDDRRALAVEELQASSYLQGYVYFSVVGDGAVVAV